MTQYQKQIPSIMSLKKLSTNLNLVVYLYYKDCKTIELILVQLVLNLNIAELYEKQFSLKYFEGFYVTNKNLERK